MSMTCALEEVSHPARGVQWLAGYIVLQLHHSPPLSGQITKLLQYNPRIEIAIKKAIAAVALHPSRLYTFFL